MTIDEAERLVYALEDFVSACISAQDDGDEWGERRRAHAVLVTLLAGPQPAQPPTPDDIGRPL